MLPDPLHPAVVHFPIALAVGTPLFAILALAALRRRWLPARAWAVVALLHVLLVASAFVALETGETEEERVEEVVAEERLEAHEEGAKRFLWIAGGTLVLTLAGLAPGRAGALARPAAALALLGVLAAGVQVGHSGGELVYRHGAAAAHRPDAAGAAPGVAGAYEREEHD